MTPTPLESARDRLQLALLAGEDTAPHRAAIAQLEADAARRKVEDSAQSAEIEAERRRALAARTYEIVAEAQSAIDVVIAQLPKIPELEMLNDQP